jgi:hypothetical protein
MHALATRPRHVRVRVLLHVKKLDDCFGQFLVRVICECGACREMTVDCSRVIFVALVPAKGDGVPLEPPDGLRAERLMTPTGAAQAAVGVVGRRRRVALSAGPPEGK